MTERFVNETIRCSKCQRWRAPYEFESKGRRAGKQIRRGVCIDCRATKPQPRYGYAFESTGERQCIKCWRFYPLEMFDICGRYEGRIYRRYRCRKCTNAYQRRRYRKLKLLAGKGEVRKHKPYRLPYRYKAHRVMNKE